MGSETHCFRRLDLDPCESGKIRGQEASLGNIRSTLHCHFDRSGIAHFYGQYRGVEKPAVRVMLA